MKKINQFFLEFSITIELKHSACTDAIPSSNVIKNNLFLIMIDYCRLIFILQLMDNLLTQTSVIT